MKLKIGILICICLALSLFLFTSCNAKEGPRGEQGLQGVQGEQGVKGDKGEQGAQGVQGESGIGISKTEINDKGELIITLSDGTLCNLGVIVGADGKDGQDGEKGDVGEQGPQGNKGDKGDTGATIEKIEFDENGKVVITLTDGTILDPVELPKNEEHVHTFGEWLNVKKATCTDFGIDLKICSECSYTESRVAAVVEHTYENGICHNCNTKDPNYTIKVNLKYDDYYDVSGKTVKIIDSGIPTSYKVGYGIQENTVLDTEVISCQDNYLVATGIGKSIVEINGEKYEFNVEPAPISILLIFGQSNAEGMVGNTNQSIACDNGQVYSTYAKADGLTGDAGLTVDNAGNYVPSALTGEYSTVNVNGTNTKLCDYPVNSLTESGTGKYGMDSGIAYEWSKQTGEKVWVINAAHGASSISSWQKGQSNFEEAIALVGACQEVLLKEITAGHFTFSHMGYYWCQGCADETRSAEWYVEKYTAMHNDLKVELSFDAVTENAELEFGNIILVMAGHENAVGYRKGEYNDVSAAFFATFKELEMRGPRVAQIWMANNPDLADINIVCTLAQDWVTMPDGSDGVEEYFLSHYDNGIINYPTQTKQSASWYAPKTPAAVKNSIHYYQVGYNEVGRESARNTLYILGEIEKPNVEVNVKFVDWTGYQMVDTIKTSTLPTPDTLVVPLVYPCYESKNVSYSLSNELTYTYYDLIDTNVSGGALSASFGNQIVYVIEREYCSYRFELSDGKMISVSNDVFQANALTQVTNQQVYTMSEPIVLKHNLPWVVEFNSIDTARFMALTTSVSTKEGMFYFFKSAVGSHVLSMGEYKDGLYQNYGIFQSKIKIDWTLPHVYRFENVINADKTNTIHIYIDDEWVGTATNLIIDGVLHSADNMYLSGKDFVFTNIGCAGFALSSNQMSYLEIWENGK